MTAPSYRRLSAILRTALSASIMCCPLPSSLCRAVAITSFQRLRSAVVIFRTLESLAHSRLMILPSSLIWAMTACRAAADFTVLSGDFAKLAPAFRHQITSVESLDPAPVLPPALHLLVRAVALIGCEQLGIVGHVKNGLVLGGHGRAFASNGFWRGRAQRKQHRKRHPASSPIGVKHRCSLPLCCRGSSLLCFLVSLSPSGMRSDKFQSAQSFSG